MEGTALEKREGSNKITLAAEINNNSQLIDEFFSLLSIVADPIEQKDNQNLIEGLISTTRIQRRRLEQVYEALRQLA